jgi:hypothetical protein
MRVGSRAGDGVGGVVREMGDGGMMVVSRAGDGT